MSTIKAIKTIGAGEVAAVTAADPDAARMRAALQEIIETCAGRAVRLAQAGLGLPSTAITGPLLKPDVLPDPEESQS